VSINVFFKLITQKSYPKTNSTNEAETTSSKFPDDSKIQKNINFEGSFSNSVKKLTKPKQRCQKQLFSLNVVFLHFFCVAPTQI
jgi:hypothetical protein